MFTAGLQTQIESINYEPFYIENLTSLENTITIKLSGIAPSVDVQYSYDNIAWYNMGSTNVIGITAVIPQNGRIYLRATATSWGAYRSATYGGNTITASENFEIGGCLSSLLFGANFNRNVNNFPDGSIATFYRLFNQSDKLIHAKKLILPKNTVNFCFYQMFRMASNLISAPNIEIGNISQGACKEMFLQCSNLTDINVFTINSVQTEGCMGMFSSCTKLTVSPIINVHECSNYGFANMFEACTSLVVPPNLPATVLGNFSYQNMFKGCTQMVTAPNLPATTVPLSAYQYMFQNCSALTTPPVISARSVGESACSDMFNGCTSLVTAPALPATTLGKNCYSRMFYGCFKLSSAPDLPATTLAQSCYGSMFSSCTALTTAPSLPATTLVNYCYQAMFYQCSSLINAPALPATTLATGCYLNMFYGCTKLSQAPLLPATVLVSSCYENMFNGASTLRYIKCLATSGFNASNALNNWTWGVYSEGVFTKADGVENWNTGNNGIPNGWTVFNESEEPDPVPIPIISKSYFYIENRDSSINTITFERTGENFPSTYVIYESNDESNWTPLTISSNSIITTISPNSKKYFKHEGAFGVENQYKPTKIKSSGFINVGGNLLSLEHGDDFIDGKAKGYSNSYAFNELFGDNIRLVDASNLIINDISVGTYGFYKMFNNCTSLISAPQYFKASLTESLYSNMFYGCSALTTVPEIQLYESKLPNSLYSNMFFGCTSLNSVVIKGNPSSYGNYVFNNMFFNCNNLNSITCLMTNINSNVMVNWVSGVSNTGTFYKNPNATWGTGANAIPSGWTVVDYQG